MTYKDKIVNGIAKNNTRQILFSEFMDYLDILDKCKYKNEANKIIESIIYNTNDDAQINTLKRILDMKPPNNIYKQYDNKTCPHCNKKHFINNNDDYMICGYSHKGYDWNGCGKDWCGQCGKKLCKQWGHNSLFNPLNRIHNNKCCKKHADKNGFDYLNDYCQCIDKHYKYVKN